MNLIETLEQHRDLDKLFSSHASPHLMSLAERQEHMKNLEWRIKTPWIILEDIQEEVTLLLGELDIWKKLNGDTLQDEEWRKLFPF
mgnify:FL=1